MLFLDSVSTVIDKEVVHGENLCTIHEHEHIVGESAKSEHLTDELPFIVDAFKYALRQGNQEAHTMHDLQLFDAPFQGFVHHCLRVLQSGYEKGGNEEAQVETHMVQQQGQGSENRCSFHYY